jgi:3'-5' exoribonuclease
VEIKDITGDGQVSGQYLILENQIRTAKNGSSYLAMKIGDQTGTLAVKIWHADNELFQSLEVGKVIELTNIHAKTFKDQIQLEWEGNNTKAFKLLSDTEVDYSKFQLCSPGNLTEYWRFLCEQIKNIQDHRLRKVLAIFFEDEPFAAQFRIAPAALKRHHAYVGGLLEHTAGVTALCKAAADYYPMVNKDLLLSGAMLHDIGKVKTYQMEKNIEGTDEGKLIGHLILGVQMVEAALAKALPKALSGEPDTEDNSLLKNSLLHLLVSHHGIMEWGSPIEPLTVEACILHHADNMDAQVQKFLSLIRGHHSDNPWVPYDPGLGKSIFLGGLTDKSFKQDISEGA